jgi:hypothetical protein
VRTCLVIVALSALAAAQTASNTYTTDINGNRIANGQVTSKDGVVTDLRQSINGKEVPLEQVEQKTLSKSGNTTVTERIIRHYGTGGQVVLTERVVSEATDNGAGESSVRSTTYRSDISGNMAEAERKTVATRKAGSATVTDTAVEKKSLSGSFEVAEKRSATSEPTSDGKKESEEVYLRDTNGNLYEAQRSATTETRSGNQTVSNTAIYEPGVNGNLALAKQNVVTTTTKPDGSSSQEIAIFGRASDGHAHEAGAPPSLTEKRVIERQKGVGGAIVQTESVQLPSVNDPGRLSAPRTVSETVCRGECDKKN